MNIRQIENKLSSIAAGVNAIGDSDSKSCMTEILNLVSEVRHYTNCMVEADKLVDGSMSGKSYTMKVEAQDRMMHYLSNFL